jgi:thiol:disulfide interchange protein DsbD
VLAQAYGAAVVAALLCSLLLLAIAGWFLGRWPAQHWSTITAVLIVLAAILLSICAPAKLEAVPQAESQAATQPGAKWEPWSPDALSRAQAQGRPVFVDFTASWCLSCQVNERVALSRPDVQAAFAAHNVVLLKADWTRHDSAITDTLATLNRSGVPAYALYAPGQADPQMLPEVLTPGIVTDALNKLPRP